MDKNLESVLKEFFESSSSFTIEMMEDLKERGGINDKDIISTLSNILATNTLLFARFAYELKKTGVDMSKIKDIIKETLECFIPYENIASLSENIIGTLNEMFSRIKEEKKTLLH